MPHTWQLQDAKAKFSELVRRAISEGPQVVTYRGRETAVVLSMEDYQRMERGRPSLTEYLLGGPKLDDEAVAMLNERLQDTGRDIDL